MAVTIKNVPVLSLPQLWADAYCAAIAHYPERRREIADQAVADFTSRWIFDAQRYHWRFRTEADNGPSGSVGEGGAGTVATPQHHDGDEGRG